MISARRLGRGQRKERESGCRQRGQFFGHQNLSPDARPMFLPAILRHFGGYATRYGFVDQLTIAGRSQWKRPACQPTEPAPRWH